MWGLTGNWSGKTSVAKDAPNRAENGGCPQGFWLGMSFAEDATFGLKSLNFL